MNKTILVDNNRYVECECDHEHAKPVDDFGDYVCSGARFNVCEIVKCYETQIQESNQSIKRPSNNNSHRIFKNHNYYTSKYYNSHILLPRL